MENSTPAGIDCDSRRPPPGGGGEGGGEGGGGEGGCDGGADGGAGAAERRRVITHAGAVQLRFALSAPLRVAI